MGTTVTGLLVTDNFNFDPSTRPYANAITADGQLIIGSTATPNLRTGTITSPLGTLTIGYSSPNITMDLTGGTSAIEKITLQTGTTPTTPLAGLITFNGAVVAAGTNPVRTNGTAVHTMALQVQTSQAIAAADATKIGLSNFKSTDFAVDSTGFVSLASGAAIKTINGDTGSITGSSVTIYANGASNGSLAGVGNKFVNSGTVSTLQLGDSAVTGNLFLGANSGNTASTAASSFNTGVGLSALHNLSSGISNTALGTSALFSVAAGSYNTALGTQAGSTISTGNYNVAIGDGSLISFNGSLNVAVGAESLRGSTGGGSNTAIGTSAGFQLATGSFNSFLGQSAGYNYTSTESSNISIGNDTKGTAGESNTLRIGVATGTGNGELSKAFIQGIAGVTVSNAQLVSINTSTGQLGSIVGSVSVWTDVTSGTQALSVSNGYFTDRSGGVTYTLPSTAVLGDVIKIDGKVGLATIAQNANQAMRFGSSLTTTGITGSAVSTNVGDCVTLRCSTAGASTIWIAENFVGNWTIA